MKTIKLPLLWYHEDDENDKYPCYLHIYKTSSSQGVKIDFVNSFDEHIPGYYLIGIAYDGFYFIDSIGYDEYTIEGIELFNSKLIINNAIDIVE